VVVVMQRIHVVGTSCSGKTTMARNLARRLGVPHVELDALHWADNWTEVPDDVMRERVRDVVAGPTWVIDGNYKSARDVLWSRADLVVWLDYALPVILSRYARRTTRRVLTRERLWNTNNVERLGMHLFQRDGLLWWILSTYRRRRREYPVWLAARPDLAHVRLRSPRASDEWLASIRP
jgi:adenylate kinase family enzyme